MKVKILSLILVFVFSVIGCFAQTYEEERRMEEDSKRAEETLKQFKEWREPKFTAFVESFLPAGKDVWTISLTRSGGFLGNSVRLVGLVNSEGTVACNEANRLLPGDALKELSEFVQTSDLKSLKKEFKPSTIFCSDCYATTMTISYRNAKKKTKTYQYSWISLPESSPEIKQFYEMAKNYTACQ